ncbi:MAG: TIGR02117 family protein [Gammaproteobacteria bacterium]|nr:TIGR02117 family protein [Gammaproteobacteria bacterium]
MKKTIRTAILTCIVLVICSLRVVASSSTHPHSKNHLYRVDVVSHGWHTGLVISASDIVERLPNLKKRFLTSNLLEFGWGDQEFYRAREVTLGITLKAILWPTQSVMHVVDVPYESRKYFPQSEVETVCLSKPQYFKLVEFLVSSFVTDNSGNVIPLEKGIYGDSQFYEGVGRFYFLQTCNKWTAKALESANLDIVSTFKLTASSVMRAIEDLESSSDKSSCVEKLIENGMPNN